MTAVLAEWLKKLVVDDGNVIRERSYTNWNTFDDQAVVAEKLKDALLLETPSLATPSADLISLVGAWFREDLDDLLILVPVEDRFLRYDWISLADLDREQFAATVIGAATDIEAGRLSLLPRYRGTEYDEERDADVIRRARMPLALREVINA